MDEESRYKRTQHPAHYLEDRLDLQNDEFKRIRGLTDNEEIKGLCDRAVKRITQHTPVIKQRDDAQSALSSRDAVIGLCKTALTWLLGCFDENHDEAGLHQPTEPIQSVDYEFAREALAAIATLER